MPLFQTEVTLIHPMTQVPTVVTMFVLGNNQAFADTVKDLLDELTAFMGHAAELRAIAAQLIIDIDAQNP